MSERRYFVSIVRNKQVRLLAGPFAKHDDALAHVEAARRLATDIDPWTCFDLFGTCSVEGQATGILNSRLGIAP